MAKLAIFIDGGYLDKLAEEEFFVWVDLQKLVQELIKVVSEKTPEAVDLLRAYYYHCPPYQSNPPTPEEMDRYSKKRKFLDGLKNIPRFEVREGRLRFKGKDAAGKPLFEQKRVDLLLGLDFALLSGKGRITHAGLLAGDSDFIPAFEVAKQEGVAVWLFHGPRQSKKDGKHTYAPELWKAADERIELTQSLMNLVARLPKPAK